MRSLFGAGVIVAPFHFLPSFRFARQTDRQSPSSEMLSMEIAVAVVEFRVWSLEEEKVSMQLLYE